MIELFQHQIEALEQTKGMNRVAYYYDMGLGKTYIGSEKLKSFQTNTNLIICQKSKITDWIEHMKSNYSFDVYDLTKKKEFEAFMKHPTGVGVINYELAWRRYDLMKLKSFTLLLDESSLIQNPTAKQTKFILKLQPSNVVMLSGTVCGGKYEHLWSQIHLLGWDITRRMYESTYVNWTTLFLATRKIQIVDKKNPYKNVDRLKQKLHDNGALFKKTEEVMNLPSQTFNTVEVENTKNYKEFMKDSIITIGDDELVGDTALTKRLYCRMIASQYNPNKLNTVKDLIDSTNDRLIIFYNFNRELDQLKSIIKKPLSIINGHTKDLTAYENEDDSITLVQYQSGAMGLNLQKANKVIYYSPTERCELYMQSQKRIHRIGQNKPCMYYKLITKNSIERGIYNAIERGVDYTDELFRKEEQTWKTI